MLKMFKTFLGKINVLKNANQLISDKEASTSAENYDEMDN
jgi:hypothetical protein